MGKMSGIICTVYYTVYCATVYTSTFAGLNFRSLCRISNHLLKFYPMEI